MTKRASSERFNSARLESQAWSPATRARAIMALGILSLGLLIIRADADEVRIQNGDHYAGRVLSLNTNILILQNSVLGKISLDRAQVAAVVLAPIKGDKTLPFTNRNDEVRMINGDCFAGRVLSLNSNTLVLLSPVLGKVSLPRRDVAIFGLGAAIQPAGSSLAAPDALSPPAGPADAASANLNQLNPSSGAVQDIQNQFLGNASPEANAKFKAMIAGLMSGRLSVDDLRAQAQSVAEQARALKRDLGNDPAAAVDGYLEILDNFLRQAPPMAATNPPSTPHR